MIARKSALIVISQFFVRFLGWIGLLVLAKVWGGFAPEALGIIGFAMAFIGLFNIIGDLGFGQAHVKRISEGKDLGTCISTFATIKLVLTTTMVLAVLIAVFIWKQVFHKGFYDATTEPVIFIFIIYYVFTNLQQITTLTFNGKGEIAKLQITSMFENFIKVPLIILVALAGVSYAHIAPAIHWPQVFQPFQEFLAKHAVGSLATTYLLGIIATFLVGIWFLRKYPLKKPSWELSKSYFSFALPILITSVIVTLSTNIDKIMIGYFWTSTEVGYYYSVQQILLIILIISAAITTVLFPAFSEYHKDKNFEKINKITLMAERYISMIMIPIAVVLILFVNSIITIMLNGSFLPAASVLIALTLYAVITSFTSPYFSLVNGLNRPGISAKIGLVMCSINIVLNYFFIPQWGLLTPLGINGPTGAAIATVISSLVGLFGFKIMAKKLTGVPLLQRHTLYHIIAGFLMACVLAYLNILIPAVHWYHILVYPLVGLVVYLSVLFMLKEFKKQDVHFFLDMVRPKEMLSYIKSELKEKK